MKKYAVLARDPTKDANELSKDVQSVQRIFILVFKNGKAAKQRTKLPASPNTPTESFQHRMNDFTRDAFLGSTSGILQNAGVQIFFHLP